MAHGGPKHNAYKTALYEKQWMKTAKNKIKRITKNGGSREIIEKYIANPKWRGSKEPIQKGKISKGKVKTFIRH